MRLKGIGVNGALHDQHGDANADANWGSEPVGLCRSHRCVCIQETVPDGASQATSAFWKGGQVTAIIAIAATAIAAPSD
jgi:hypothetical protein